MFSPQGPTARELAVQALSSVEHGYDLLAPTFDHTPFRTPDRFLDATEAALRPYGPYRDGLDVCCGTGAGARMLAALCGRGELEGGGEAPGGDGGAGAPGSRARTGEPGGAGRDGGAGGRVTGTDLSAGMLERARAAHPEHTWVRADARRLPFEEGFDLAVSFGAFGHFLPAERPAVFAGVHRALRPGGLFAFPVTAPPPIRSPWYWALAGFDGAMRVRNAVWRPPFVMYYRTFPLGPVRDDLAAAGFTVRTLALEEFGRRADGSPRCRLVLAHKGG